MALQAEVSLLALLSAQQAAMIPRKRYALAVYGG
jgi:hypothetical protein